MDKSVIGIVAKPGYKDDNDIWNRMDIVDELRLLVVQNGGDCTCYITNRRYNDF